MPSIAYQKLHQRRLWTLLPWKKVWIVNYYVMHFIGDPKEERTNRRKKWPNWWIQHTIMIAFETISMRQFAPKYHIESCDHWNLTARCCRQRPLQVQLPWVDPLLLPCRCESDCHPPNRTKVMLVIDHTKNKLSGEWKRSRQEPGRTKNTIITFAV